MDKEQDNGQFSKVQEIENDPVNKGKPKKNVKTTYKKKSTDSDNEDNTSIQCCSSNVNAFSTLTSMDESAYPPPTYPSSKRVQSKFRKRSATSGEDITKKIASLKTSVEKLLNEINRLWT